MDSEAQDIINKPKKDITLKQAKAILRLNGFKPVFATNILASETGWINNNGTYLRLKKDGITAHGDFSEQARFYPLHHISNILNHIKDIKPESKSNTFREL